MFTEISVNDINDFRLGHASNKEAGTGVTVIYFPDGATAGCDISGGGPASRETPLTMPMTADNPINAIVLSGGSAYGLAASDGVMTCLEEHGIGYNTGVSLVPLVCQSCIFDLGYGSSKVRPDSTMGYEACIKALMKAGVVNTDASTAANSIATTPFRAVSVPNSATVGKIMGMKQAEKSGLGIYSVKAGTFIMTAIVVVNALGDISDYETGKKLAGLKNADRTEYVSCEEALYQFMAPRDMFTGNTTIGAVITNAAFNKAELNKIASMARNAYARCINPVGTMADGDTIYAASTAKRGGSEAVHVDINFAGTLAAHVMSAAIKNAVINSKISDEEFLSMVK
ncbi:MAG: P1 family peptidase [Lachnospira eligens]